MKDSLAQCMVGAYHMLWQNLNDMQRSVERLRKLSDAWIKNADFKETSDEA